MREKLYRIHRLMAILGREVPASYGVEPEPELQKILSRLEREATTKEVFAREVAERLDKEQIPEPRRVR